MLQGIIPILMIIQIIASVIWMFVAKEAGLFVLVCGIVSIYRAFTIITGGNSFSYLLSEICVLAAIYNYYDDTESIAWCFIIFAIAITHLKGMLNDFFDETPLP